VTLVDDPIAGDADADAAWTLEYEKHLLARLAGEVDFQVPAEKVPSRAPATAEEKDRFYEHWTYVGALDLFIIENCAKGIGHAPDPQFELFLTRQIADDGYHAQRFREQVAEVSGRDPIKDMERHTRHQWEVFGDLSGQSWEGFLAFEVHYEIYVVPSFFVGRKATIADPRLSELGAERFFPDELYHRSWIIGWWKRFLAAADPGEAGEATARLRALDDEGEARRTDDLVARWRRAEAATGADHTGFDRLHRAWRAAVQDHLYGPPAV
jgi:hypothetical protein